MPRVSVVIPTWNGAALLHPCLVSLRSQRFRDFEVIVVDNGSTDGTLEMLGREFPEVVSVALPENRGFAPAVNEGIRRASGGVVVLLNNDVEAEPGWMSALVAALDRRPDVGFVASKMLDAKRPGLIDSAGDRMSLFAWNHGRGQPDGSEFDTGREILTACAGAAAYRRELFEAVGLLDEEYFAWFEDVDLGLRAQIAGFRCWYEPTAVVRHHGSATGARMSDMKVFYTYRNTMLLFLKTMPLPRLLAWGPLMFVWPWLAPLVSGMPLRLTLHAWRAFLRLVPHALRERRRIYGRRRVPLRHITSLLDDPMDDVARGIAVVWARLRRRPIPVPIMTRGDAA